MRPQIVFVVDEKFSPLWRAANSHAKSCNIEILCSNEFASINNLVRVISKLRPHCIVFSWRGAFDSVMSSSRARNVLKKSEVYIFLLVPDLMGVAKQTQSEQLRIDLADGLLVTSRELQDKYRSTYELRNIQILHDLIPFEILDSVLQRNVKRRGKQIIWIGNSRWGRRQGFIDHKGLRSIAIPVLNQLRTYDRSINLKIIDSSRKRMPYREVMKELAESDCLIFTSKSEGTGLPIIEAAYLGTPVVTFEVGIASEVLTDELSDLISSRSVDVFAGKVLDVLGNVEDYSKIFSKRARQYRREIASEIEELNLVPNDLGNWRDFRSKFRLKLMLKWLARWIHYKAVKFRVNFSQQ